MNTTQTGQPKRVVKMLPNKLAKTVSQAPARVRVLQTKHSAPPMTKIKRVANNETRDFVSPVVTQKKSKTAIKIDRFNTMIGSPLTDRDLAAVRAIKADHAGRQFDRGSYDAGILRRLGERGHLKTVDGSQERFQLTRAALMA